MSIHPAPKKQAVLHVCHSYAPPYQDVARQYCALFPRNAWHITTVFLTGAPVPGMAEAIGSDEVIFFAYPSRALRGLKLGPLRRLRQLVHDRSFALAIAQRHKALYLCTQLPDLFTFGVHHRPGGYRRWGRRWYVRRKRDRLALLGVSNDVRDDMRRDLPDFPPERIETLYNRIQPDALEAALLGREAARERLQLPDHAYVFGTAGRLHPDKDQATLIRGFARVCAELDNALLVIMGKGRLESSLKALARELGVADRVRFPGMVPDGRRYFRAFDSFVLSSDREPFGMVLLEAMVADLPIAAAASGGALEVVGDTGLTFPFGDEAALGECLLALYRQNAAEREAQGRRQKQRMMTCFTDAAVSQVFWQLPAVQALGLEGGCMSVCERETPPPASEARGG